MSVFKQDRIYFLRLKNGHDIVAVIATEPTHQDDEPSFMEIRNVMRVVVGYSPEGQEVLQCIEWLPGSIVASKSVPLYLDDILTFGNVTDEVMKYYHQMVSKVNAYNDKRKKAVGHMMAEDSSSEAEAAATMDLVYDQMTDPSHPANANTAAAVVEILQKQFGPDYKKKLN